MTEDLIHLVVGFVFTSVVGGALGYYLQNRAWKHQHDVAALESERQTATAVFEALSILMDKRLYRMRQVAWKLSEEGHLAERVDEQMENYRQLLFEWNDGLNRNLAMVERYFGTGVRKRLDYHFYEEFARIGVMVERCHRAWQQGEQHRDLRHALDSLNALSSYIYNLNVLMINRVQIGRIGVWADDGAQRTRIRPESGTDATDRPKSTPDTAHRASYVASWMRRFFGRS